MDHYQKGEVKDFADFWTRLTGATWDTLKGYTTGVATAGAGAVGGLPAEIVTMTSVGAALENKVPEP